MNKKIIIGLAVAILVIAGAVTYFVTRPGNSYVNAIPSDARAVAVLNLPQLAAQLQLSDVEIKQIVQKYAGDESGLDITRPVYGFLSSNGYFGAVLPVSDKGELESTLQGNGFQLEEQRGLHWATRNGWLASFDGSKCLIMGPASMGDLGPLRNQMATLMKQDKSESASLQKIQEVNDSPFAFIASLDAVPQSYASVYKQVLPRNVEPSDVSMLTSLSVDGKNLNLSSQLLSDNPEVQKNFKSLNEMSGTIKGDLLQISPENPFLFATANIQGDKLLEQLRQNPTIRTALIALNMAVDADMMIRSVSGDVAVAMPQLSLKQPQLLFTGSLANTDFLANVDSWKTGMANDAGVEFRVQHDNDFYLRSGDKSGFFGVRQGKLYVTQSQDLADEALKPADNKAIQEIASLIQANKLFVTMDIHQALQGIAPFALMLGTDKGLSQTLNALDRINLYTNDFQNFTLQLTSKTDVSEVIKTYLK